MAKLAVGDKAPAIALKDENDKLVRLSSFKGKRVVLYFYPKADTPGCTTQSCNLRDAFPHPYTEHHAREFIRAVRIRHPETTFAIDVDGIAVGSIGYVLHADVERVSAEIGYWIAEPFWGKGIATDALAAVTAHAVATHGLTRIYAVPLTANGLGYTAAPRLVLSQGQLSSPGETVENPQLLHVDGTYFLLFSRGQWWSPDYRQGYAVCAGVFGPCLEVTSSLIGSYGTVRGPGGGSAFTDGSGADVAVTTAATVVAGPVATTVAPSSEVTTSCSPIAASATTATTIMLSSRRRATKGPRTPLDDEDGKKVPDRPALLWAGQGLWSSTLAAREAPATSRTRGSGEAKRRPCRAIGTDQASW